MSNTSNNTEMTDSNNNTEMSNVSDNKVIKYNSHKDEITKAIFGSQSRSFGVDTMFNFNIARYIGVDNTQINTRGINMNLKFNDNNMNIAYSFDLSNTALNVLSYIAYACIASLAYDIGKPKYIQYAPKIKEYLLKMKK